ncbi:MAG: hypothetical protein HYV90_04175 [Candidatus Woesebacteria bacterium]|nr:MAG: hypothetical protein HYV90_04175 [Candidatus Woesebacteria bacterium]
MGPKKSVHLRDALLLLFALIFVLGVGYKYLEWSVFDKLAKLHHDSIPNELSILEKSSSFSEDAIADIVRLSDPKSSPTSRLVIYDELDGKINLALDIDKSYVEAVEINASKYKPLVFLSKLLVGERGKLARRIVLDQVEYYEKEGVGAYDNVVSDYLLKNIFAVSKDKDIMQIYDEKASISPEKLYPKYFSEIASLEKYTRSDFKFPEEDAIRESYSYGYETLQNNKNYLSAYYAVIKDFVAGDYESASYKFSKLQDQYIKLNVDMDRLFGENRSAKQDKSKQIIELVVDKDTAIKEFKNKNFGKYPLLAFIGGWKEDLEMCQIYYVKGSLASDMSKKPIDAKDTTAYMDWLSKMNPSTSTIDNLFDKSVIKFTNTDEKLTFQCLDKETGKEYTFVTTK